MHPGTMPFAARQSHECERCAASILGRGPSAPPVLGIRLKPAALCAPRSASPAFPASQPAMTKGASSNVTAEAMEGALKQLPAATLQKIADKKGKIDEVVKDIGKAILSVDPTGTPKPLALKGALAALDLWHPASFSKAGKMTSEAWVEQAAKVVRKELHRHNNARNSQKSREVSKEADAAKVGQPADHAAGAMKRPAAAAAAPLCACGKDLAACGACGRGWAQQAAAPAEGPPTSRLRAKGPAAAVAAAPLPAAAAAGAAAAPLQGAAKAVTVTVPAALDEATLQMAIQAAMRAQSARLGDVVVSRPAGAPPPKAAAKAVEDEADSGDDDSDGGQAPKKRPAAKAAEDQAAAGDEGGDGNKMKRPASHGELKKVTFDDLPEDFSRKHDKYKKQLIDGKLGCSKCSWSVGGCSTCKDTMAKFVAWKAEAGFA